MNDRAENIRRLKMQAELPKPKKVYVIPSISKKKQMEMDADKKGRVDGETELQKWFKARQREMTGYCCECGAKTETSVYKYAILSICHILAKRPNICPSVAFHPRNWIELCPDHHTKFDNSTWEEIERWGIWPEILDRLIEVEPFVDRKERRHLPPQLIAVIEKMNAK